MSSSFPCCITSGEHPSSQLPALLQVVALQITLSFCMCCFLLSRKAVEAPSLLSQYREHFFLPGGDVLSEKFTITGKLERKEKGKDKGRGRQK